MKILIRTWKKMRIVSKSFKNKKKSHKKNKRHKLNKKKSDAKAKSKHKYESDDISDNFSASMKDFLKMRSRMNG